jgi:valyl-tRNA synthetase
MTDLPKTFDPAAIEQRWYEHWERGGLFRPDRPDAKPWTIVMPPPNVTGSLHIGHALDNTLQDVLTRRERMLGKDALWVVGTDHAGIATQMVVERNLDSQGIKRAEIGREAFLEHVWEWKAQSGGAITRQLRRLGASCDWAHERFTMDERYQRAVIHTFVEMHKRGLIYRDKRLVNWDPKFQTAISDLEVETRDQQGKFWHLKYPLEDRKGFISVATTRPETMLADMAVAVHPDDKRYRHLIGECVRLPITSRLIAIIADEHADPELGSGAVKITPGHDFNDFEVGRRADMRPSEMWNVLDAHARIVAPEGSGVPRELVGLDRFEARTRVVEMLDEMGLIERVEDRVIPTPFGDRSGVVIEPWLTDQWYVDAAKLALPALQAVKKGDIRVVPETWKKTWYNWLENIQPWCVSRQLWWGHRIPAWYGPSKKADGTLLTDVGSIEGRQIFVAETEEDAKKQAEDFYGPDWPIEFSDVPAAMPWVQPLVEMGTRKVVRLNRDNDVLDTWFSSALWPFATLGWPEQTDDLKRHYPNDVLISGFDILFFWDARMAMQGIELMGEAPWKTLYLHGLVRDAQGAKMSKSKGNTVDPLGLIDKYGADALRFTLAAMESQGRDIKLDEKRVEGYRNFATKLWNAARFLQMNGVGASDSIAAPAAELPVNRWIVGEVVETLGKLDRAFDELRYDEMADAIYHFVWGTFCDWYVELVKGAFDEETKHVAAWAFDQILVMLHPLMPFITEELWHAMGERPYDLIVAKWPDPAAEKDWQLSKSVSFVISFIEGIRSQRLEVGFKPGDKVPVAIVDATDDQLISLNRFKSAVERIARVQAVSIDQPPPPDGGAYAVPEQHFMLSQKPDEQGSAFAQFVVEDLAALGFAEGLVDLAAERTRLEKTVEGIEKERDSLAQRLANPNFTERAKPEAVEKARSDHEAKAAEAERLRAALERLG